MGFSGLRKNPEAFEVCNTVIYKIYCSLQNTVRFQYGSDRDRNDRLNKAGSCLKPYYVGYLTGHESSCKVSYNDSHV